jgi:D-alanyl-D-alanine carboxypeptidase
MGRSLEQSLLDEWLARLANKRNVFSTVLCVEDQMQSLSLVSSGGEMQTEDRYFIASVTKLYVTAVLLKLRAEQRIGLDDPIGRYLSKEIMAGLHMMENRDYTEEITVKQLMSNTSGIPDYFSGDVFSDLIAGHDQAWSLDKTLNAARRQKPKFKPGQRNKAQYSDTNYRLLGQMIENIKGESIQSVFKEYIFDKLNLTQTYFFDDPEDTSPVPFYYKKKRLDLPLYMASIGTEGGIVSTARETMIFLRSFFNGDLFPISDLDELQRQWNFLWAPGPFFYGIGISRQPLSPFGLRRGLIGHWGQSGAFAFHHPESGLYFTGTVNQAVGQSAAVQAMTRIIRQYGREKKALRLHADAP